MERGLTKEALDRITYRIIGAAIEVHKSLGAGLLEGVYHKCLKQEFTLRNIKHVSQMMVPIHYKGVDLRTDLRCDFLIEEVVAVEIKAVENLTPVFESQILTYMKLLGVPKGLIINFNCDNIFKGGQQTFVNELYRNLP